MNFRNGFERPDLPCPPDKTSHVQRHLAKIGPDIHRDHAGLEQAYQCLMQVDVIGPEDQNVPIDVIEMGEKQLIAPAIGERLELRSIERFASEDVVNPPRTNPAE